MSETRLREEIVRFARSLFERGLTPARPAISASGSRMAAGW